MTNKRPNIWRNYLIALRLCLCTFATSLRVLWSGFSGKAKRSRFDAIVHAWARKLLKIVHVNCRVYNPHAVSLSVGRPCIIMSNHASHFDIPLVFAAFPHGSIRMLAKKELFRIPLFGRAMRVGEIVSIDRHNRHQAIKDLEFAKQKMQSGIILWVAPEGTRSLTGKLGHFKKGGFRLALDTKAIIVPLTIKGSNKILPAKTLNFHFDTHIELHIGKPIDAQDYAPNDLPRLMHDVEIELCRNM